MMGSYPFFLPTRKLGELLGAHWTRIAGWLRAFEVLKIIHLAPGEVRKAGGNRSPRYFYGPARGSLTQYSHPNPETATGVASSGKGRACCHESACQLKTALGMIAAMRSPILSCAIVLTLSQPLHAHARMASENQATRWQGRISQGDGSRPIPNPVLPPTPRKEAITK